MTVLVLLLFAFLFQQAGASVEGVVLRAEAEPVADARVLLARLDGSIADSVGGISDERGRFAIVNVPPGRYRVFVEHEDFVRSEYQSPIAVAAGQRLQGLSFVLTPFGSISGRVLSETGDPVPRIFVRALTSRVVAETKTNDLGEYRLFGLPAATYVVSAERYAGPRIEEPARGVGAGRGLYYITPGPPSPDSPGEGQSRQTLTGLLSAGGFIDPHALTGQTYPPVFYPGTTDRAIASAVDLRAGAQLSGIDMQLVIRER